MNNTYCVDLHFDYDPIINKHKFANIPENNNEYMMTYYNLFDIVSPRFILDMHKCGIIISTQAELFYTRKGSDGSLHSDVPTRHSDFFQKDDYVKINFMFGGSQSLMNWYNPNEGETGVLGLSYGTGAPASRWDKNKVTHVHSATVGYPSLIQVGVPHDITNNLIEDRFVICLIPLLNKRRLTMNKALEMLATYIGVP